MTTPNGHKPQPEMTLGELAMQCVNDSGRWFPEMQVNVPHHMLALAGEVGELANIIKKVDRGDLDFNEPVVRHDAAMELTDIFIYVLNLAGLMRVNLYEAYRLKRAENDKRFMARRRQLDEEARQAAAPKLIVPGQE